MRTCLILALLLLAGLAPAALAEADERTTVNTVRAQIPTDYEGDTAERLPLRYLYAVPSSHYFSLKQHWIGSGLGPEPEVIVVANGTYRLADVHRLLGDESVLARVGEGIYLARRPIYVSPTATLVMQGVELRLSLRHGSMLVYNGELFVVDSTVTSWNERRGDHGPRQQLPKSELRLYGRQPLRPYITGMQGSKSWFANSLIRGLGYRGRSASYGLSLAATGPEKPGVLVGMRRHIAALPPPTGVFVGNTVTECFFGFFTNRADDVALIGNLFHHNVVYNVDPHDFTGRMQIVANVTHSAGSAHGIIISREVDGASIVDNLSFGNAGSGIMLDRSSRGADVRGNLVFGNGGDGIAVLESDDNRLRDNTIFANAGNGVYVRNSSRVTLEDNRIRRNGNNGVEVAVMNIDDHQTRSLLRDPYTQAGQASIVNNLIELNISSAIASKNWPGLLIRGNRFQGSGPRYFAGDLEAEAATVIAGNEGEGYRRTSEDSP